MRSWKYCLGLLVIMATLGIGIIGCGQNRNENNKNNIIITDEIGINENSIRNITITEFNNYLYSDRQVRIHFYPEYDFLSAEDNFPIIRGFPHIIGDDVEVSGEKLTFQLRQNGIWAKGEVDWYGSYYVFIFVLDREGIRIYKTYIFTKGISPNERFTNIPKFSIGGNGSINISFNLFSEIVLKSPAQERQIIKNLFYDNL